MTPAKAILFGLALTALSACGPASRPKPKPADVQAAQAFLAANAKAPGVHVLPDGLQYKITASGPPGGNFSKSPEKVRDSPLLKVPITVR